MFSITAILGICATFFTILILLIHGTVIGYRTYKAQQQKKRDKQMNLAQLLKDINSEDDKVVKQAQAKLSQLLIAKELNK